MVISTSHTFHTQNLESQIKLSLLIWLKNIIREIVCKRQPTDALTWLVSAHPPKFRFYKLKRLLFFPRCCCSNRNMPKTLILSFNVIEFYYICISLNVRIPYIHALCLFCIVCAINAKRFNNTLNWKWIHRQNLK